MVQGSINNDLNQQGYAGNKKTKLTMDLRDSMDISHIDGDSLDIESI